MLSRPRRIGLMLLLFGMALAIRLPNLHLVPRFEDEGVEVMRALEIANGTAPALTGYDLYYGPLFSWIVAGLFRLSGGNLETARMVAAFFGALTVPAIYGLARAVANDRAAVVAALFGTVSPMLVIVGSHFGWSNSLTPFFATVTLTAVYTGVTERRPAVLALGSFLAGLTVQTHPLSVVLVAALAGWYLLDRPPSEWFRRREMYWAMAGFVLGYAPMLWTLSVRLAEVTSAVQNQTYAYGTVDSAGQYLERLTHELRLFVGIMAGVGERLWAALPEVPRTRRILELITAVVITFGVLVSCSPRSLAGAAVARSRTFVPVILLLPLVLLPLFTRSLHSRYLLFLVPIACLCGGVAFARLWERLAQAPAETTAVPDTVGRPELIGVLVLALAINAVAIVRVERRALSDGDSNAPFFALQKAIEQHAVRKDGVFIEDTDALRLPAGALRTWTYFNYQAVQFVLRMNGCAQTIAPAGQLLEMLQARRFPTWLIIPEQSVPAFSAHLTLTRIISVDQGPGLPAELKLTLFRVQPHPGK